LDLEYRKHRRTVLFDIGIQLRRVYDVAEQQPVPERIARLLDSLGRDPKRGVAGETGTAEPRERP
jgi:hypothetical protein